MERSVNLSRSLEELENDKWGKPKFDSHLVQECHRLRAKPLKDLTNENIRILVGQKIGLKYIVPLALDILEVDLLASGDMFKGDLLANIFAIGSEFWKSNPDLYYRKVDLKSEIREVIDTLAEIIPQADVNTL